MNYFDSNRTNTVILKFETSRWCAGSGYSINLLRYGILQLVKLGIKRLKAKLWLKLWLKIPKRILLTRFNMNFIIGLNAFFRSLFMHSLDQFTHKQIKVRRH